MAMPAASPSVPPSPSLKKKDTSQIPLTSRRKRGRPRKPEPNSPSDGHDSTSNSSKKPLFDEKEVPFIKRRRRPQKHLEDENPSINDQANKESGNGAAKCRRLDRKRRRKYTIVQDDIDGSHDKAIFIKEYDSPPENHEEDVQSLAQSPSGDMIRRLVVRLETLKILKEAQEHQLITGGQYNTKQQEFLSAFVFT